MRDWIGRHFRRHCLRSPLQFSVLTAFEAVAVGLSLAILLYFAGFDTRTDLNELDAVPLFDAVVIVAPILETVFFQMIPIICMRWLRVPFS